MAQRKGLVELIRRHPAVLVDDAAPGADQHATEAGQRHFGERHEQLEQAGLVWRDGSWNVRRRDGGRRGIRGHGAKLERRLVRGQPKFSEISSRGTLLSGSENGLASGPALFFLPFSHYLSGARS